MGKLRVGVANGLHCKPLAWGFLKGHFEGLISASLHPPAVIAQLLRQGNLDAGLVSPLEYQTQQGLLLVPDLCVSLAGGCGPPLLAMNKPLEDVRSIAVDPTARCHEALLSIVLGERFAGKPPRFDHQPAPGRLLGRHDAVLLTDHEALQLEVEGYETLDLAEAWAKLTGLPWVVCLWACRSQVVLPDLTFYFKSSLRFGLAALDGLARESAAELNLSVAQVEDALGQGLGFFLKEAELASLDEFSRRAAAMNLIPRVQPLRFLA